LTVGPRRHIDRDRFPQFREMSLGVWDIQVRAAANVSATGADVIKFLISTRTGPRGASNLVNALVPAIPGFRSQVSSVIRRKHRLTLITR